ncbi:MAG: dienelactone hydrolase family protein [Pseudomonadota bacterium]
MKRIIFIGFAIVLLALGFAYVKREPLLLGYFASKTPTVALAEHEDFLRTHIQYRPPATGAGPYPAVALFHGCVGVRQAFMDQWADAVNEAGYMAVIIDSLGPRGVGFDEAWETVCKGQRLIGQERAGDVQAALNIIKARPDIDGDKIVLAGWSHGAWTLMDFLTMDMKRARPTQLRTQKLVRHEPEGVILFYPYCGQGARSRFAGWAGDAPAITFIAGSDRIVNADECLSVFKALERRGESIDLHYYPDADHVFDNAALEGEDAQYYIEEYANDATEKVKAFLATRK